jgi:hypothetical protein
VPDQDVLLDNDILLKACRYFLVPTLLDAVSGYGEPAVLGSAKFVLSHRIARSRALVNKARVAAALDALLKAVSVLEPDDEEVLLAANFQEQAQLLNLALDPGESILLAILVLRRAALLVTGDKRAIVAAEAVLKQQSLMVLADGKVACLEQLAAECLRAIGPEALRASICADREADRSMTICFSCGSDGFSGSNTSAGLSSYVRDVRASAPTILVRSDDLSALLS